jgi:low affinity Fe/Cu permease
VKTPAAIGATLFKHPAERAPERQRGRFEQVAEKASFLASSPPFFALCFAAVLVWAIGLACGVDNRFLTAVSGAMTALTLALVALVKNADMRSELAIQRKLDAIASALLDDRRGMNSADTESGLEDAIGLHDEI